MMREQISAHIPPLGLLRTSVGPGRTPALLCLVHHVVRRDGRKGNDVVTTSGRRHMHDVVIGQLGHLPHRRPVLVAIDGPDAAGKTTLAHELSMLLARVRPVIRASIDGFHRPRQVRYRRDPLSPEGYYEDSFDYEAVRSRLLVPLRHGDRHFVPAVFDLDADVPVLRDDLAAPADAILLFDGVFLQRAELRRFWDLVIYLHIDEAEVLRRARARDVRRFGSAEEVERRYRARYLPGQAIYRSRVDPIGMADIVIDNTDVAVPTILRVRESRPAATGDESNPTSG